MKRLELVRRRRIIETIELKDCEDAITRILYIDYKSRIALDLKDIKILLFDKFLIFELWLRSILDEVVDARLALLFEFVAKEAFWVCKRIEERIEKRI